MKRRTFIANIILGCLAGVACGIGGYTFIYARGASYLTDNPAACANCHVMGDHYKGWVQSSHRSVATMNAVVDLIADRRLPPGPRFPTLLTNPRHRRTVKQQIGCYGMQEQRKVKNRKDPKGITQTSRSTAEIRNWRRPAQPHVRKRQ